MNRYVELVPHLKRYLFYPEEAEEDEIEGTVMVRSPSTMPANSWPFRSSAG